MNNNMQKSTSRRFFLRNSQIPADIKIGDRYLVSSSVEGDLHHQLHRVFRAVPGQTIILMNKNSDSDASGEGVEFLFELQGIEKKSLQLILRATKVVTKAFKERLGLALCLPNKPAKLDFIIEKAVEMGITNLKLIKSDFSQFSHQLRPDRLEKIILEAAEQSEQPQPAMLEYFENLDQFLKKQETKTLVALERDNHSASILSININHDVDILIGPEGGFSEREINLINQADLTPINLGGSILKMDTAALLSIGIAALKLQSKAS